MHLPTWTKKKEKTHNDSIIKVLQSPPFLILHHSQVVARSLFFSITSSSLAYLSPSQTPPHRARKQSNEIESKKSAIVQCITYWGGLLPTCSIHHPLSASFSETHKCFLTKNDDSDQRHYYFPPFLFFLSPATDEAWQTTRHPPPSFLSLMVNHHTIAAGREGVGSCA